MYQFLRNIKESLRLLPTFPAGMKVIYLPSPGNAERRLQALPCQVSKDGRCRRQKLVNS
jgi:hypothetical protein